MCTRMEFETEFDWSPEVRDTKFRPYVHILVRHDDCGAIRSQEGKKKIWNFAKYRNMKIVVADYSRPDFQQPPDLLVECLGTKKHVKEAEEFVQSMLPQTNSGVKILGGTYFLPPLAPNVIPTPSNVSEPKRLLPMKRTNFGRRGEQTIVFTNYCEVELGSDDYFYRYSVSICYEDNSPVQVKGIAQKCIDRFYQIHSSELTGIGLAYDGAKTLFTVSALPLSLNSFTVVLEDSYSNRVPADGRPSEHTFKRSRQHSLPHVYKVGIDLVAKIPVRAIARGLRGEESENPQVALQVLNMILRQNAAKQGSILVRQSIFCDDQEYFHYLGGGLTGWWGLYSSFRATQDGLFLNMDLSTTVTTSPVLVTKFLCTNQFVRDPYQIDWEKAKRTLKNLRVKSLLTNEEFKITSLSELPCSQQLISITQNKDAQSTEVTVFDYYVYTKNAVLSKLSADMPCINVGNPKKPIFIPVELCQLVSLQRRTKELLTPQTSNLGQIFRQNRSERLTELAHALSSEKIFGKKVPGVSIVPEFTRMSARVISAPKLISGNGEVFPQNGRWNFNNQRLVLPAKVENWAIVNFSAQQCDIQKLWTDLVRCGNQKGIEIAEPSAVIEETLEDSRGSPVDRVNIMFKKIKDIFSGPNKFLLCLLPERKNSALYGPWKKINLADHGIVTQCVAPQPGRVNDRYLTNVLLKINAKLGGLNSFLSPLPLSSESATMILGMNVSPGQSDRPSIAAVVGSRQWPSISRYSAAVRTQSRKVEMIDSLFKKVSDTVDEGIIRELLFDFYGSSRKRLPDQMVIFRAGVGESQFKQVLSIELAQIIEACKFIDESWSPKFTVIVAQKSRHTRFFNDGGNVPPGTVIDTNVCHPRYNDFYMCTYDGAAVISRPTHYHVLLDEIGFSPDDLQELVYSLSHGCQRSTTATSVVAPLRYARLAAAQVAKFMKSETSRSTSVPQVPSLHKNVSRSMFFC